MVETQNEMQMKVELNLQRLFRIYYEIFKFLVVSLYLGAAYTVIKLSLKILGVYN